MKRTKQYLRQKQDREIWNPNQIPPCEPTQRERPLAEIIRGAVKIKDQTTFEDFISFYPDNKVRPYKGHWVTLCTWVYPITVFIGPRC